MTRTEDDLRAAFVGLAGQAPDPWTVLRAVRSARRPAPRRLLPVALSVAAASAAAVLTLSLAGQGSGTGTDRVPALRARFLSAIDAARGDILYAHDPGSRGGTWVSPWYPRHGQQVRIRLLRRNARGVIFKDAEYTFAMPAGRARPGAGNPIDWGMLTATGTVLVVDHQRRTWGEWHHAGITVAIPVSPAGIRAEIARGRLRVIGRTTLRGRQAIELGMILTQDNGGPVLVTVARLWIDAGTYLPMRQYLRFSTGAQDLTDYAFLPPTAANLARLRPVVPAGYRRSSLRPGGSRLTGARGTSPG